MVSFPVLCVLNFVSKTLPKIAYDETFPIKNNIFLYFDPMENFESLGNYL